MPPSTTITISDDAWWAQNTDYIHQSSCKVSWSASWGPGCKVGPARYQTHHAQMTCWHTQMKSQKVLYLKRKTQKKFNLMGLKKGSGIPLHRLNMTQFQGVSFSPSPSTELCTACFAARRGLGASTEQFWNAFCANCYVTLKGVWMKSFLWIKAPLLYPLNSQSSAERAF